ncbi:MAG: acetylxylan esterase, partial [Planctomycetes bacterium]|nr:acetylxylan esterase [Planctomycetota bacterium]
MNARDTSLPVDGRLYRFKNYQSVIPLPEWGTLAEWMKERKKIRRHLWLCTGLNDTTSAFKPRGRVIRKFEHEGIVVENIRIETLPGLYVMGNLYLPKDSSQRLPLVLHPHGHGMRSRTVAKDGFSVPHRAMNFALMGFASFAWSMIAHDEDMMQIEHRALLSGPEKEVCNVLGLSVFGLQLHNGMKVLDYLCGRKEIDARRIGCTGESGGATQTYYLAALDDRIKVVAPAVMLSGHYQGGCVCENAPHLHLEYSTVHYAALIAPRPMFLTGCTGDWTHHMREREFASMRDLYRLYDREDAVDSLFQDERHNYNRRSREHVYAWMTRWLVDSTFTEKRIRESGKPVPQPEQLLVHDTPVPPVKGVIRSNKALIRVWADLHERAASIEETQALLGLDLPEKADLLVRNRTPKYASKGKVLSENRMDYGRFSEDSHLTCRFVLPDKGKRTHLILGKWKRDIAWRQFVSRPPSVLQKLIEDGDGVIVPLLFGQNVNPEISRYRQDVEASYLYTSYNRTAHEHLAGDIVTTVRLAQVEMGVSPSDIVIVAENGVSLISLVAWSALCAQKAIGSFVGDFLGIDFANPTHWVKNAYVPL